ncbi:MAG: amidohydrolase [Deltaproteobacteria bacterium]|nr:amidohydrolase [Deltaproteobacteria bacterium]
MRVIDCDAHVEESVESWQYLAPEYYLLRPIPVVFPEDTCFGTHNAAWVIDYKLRFFASNPTSMKRARDKGVPIPVQEMRDVKQRLACMDELGIDVQVVFPSLWLGCLAENVELEDALARSYNQFMATRCGESGGRLQYVAVVSWRRPDLAIQEIRRVKKLGGVAGIFARGIEWDRPLTLPSHWPIFEEAAEQDLPVTVHVGNGSSPVISRMLEGVPRPVYDEFPQIHPLGKGLISGPYVLYAFQQVLGSSLLDDFPKLRVAFMEAGIDWAPRLVKALGGSRRAKVERWLTERVFVSCALDDELPLVTNKLGDDFIVTATDFPHGDAFRQDQLAQGLKKRGDLSDKLIEKILSGNPRRLYSMEGE